MDFGFHLYLLKVFLKISQYSYENTCVRVSKVCKFIQKRLQQSCFHVNIVKFLRAPILKNICERLLLFASLQLLTF